jgi:flagellar motor component MotA
LAITLVELAYVVWMVTVPDWSTVWTAMIVFALVAAVYGAALALTVMTPRTTAMLFDLDENRDAARLWCASVVVVTSLMTYVTGTIGYKWRKAHHSGG